MRRVVPVLLLGCVALGACGDDDAGGSSTAEELAPYSHAVAGRLEADNAGEGFDFTGTSASCVAARAVGVVGLDRLEAVGTPHDVVAATRDDLSVFDLQQRELDEISAAYLDCVDGAEKVLRDAFLSGSGLEGDESACVAGLVDRELLIRILSAGLGGQDPQQALGTDVRSEFAACS